MEVRVRQLFMVIGLIIPLIATHQIFAQKCNITVQLQKQDPSCNGSKDGKIALSLIGAVEPVKVHWNTGAQSMQIANVPAGAYTVYILDGNGCSLKKEVQLTNKAHFSPEITVQNSQGSDQEVIINSSDSNIQKAYFTDYSDLSSIKKLEYQGERIRNIPSGSYMVDIVDHRGCVSSHSLVLNDNN